MKVIEVELTSTSITLIQHELNKHINIQPHLNIDMLSFKIQTNN